MPMPELLNTLLILSRVRLACHAWAADPLSLGYIRYASRVQYDVFRDRRVIRVTRASDSSQPSAPPVSPESASGGVASHLETQAGWHSAASPGSASPRC